jgi:Cdc6-like AAA superfamily ATPase
MCLTKLLKLTLSVRMVKSSFQYDEDQQMRKIVAQEAKVSSLAILSDAKIQQDTSKDLEKPMNRLVDQAAVGAKTLEENQYREVLSWLSPVPFVRHHERHSESRIPGSGKWLLDHPQYLSWRNSSNSLILLLHGIKGSGKTFLASAVVDSFFKESSKQTSSAPIAYFYCAKNASELERADPDEIMRSIVRQLTLINPAQRLVYEALLIECGRRKVEAKIDGFDLSRLRVEECVKLILNVTSSNPAVIVVDALDEIQEDRRHELVDALKQIITKSESVIKILITTRDNSNVIALLSDASKLRIYDHDNRADMKLFVHHHVTLAIQGCNLLNENVSNDPQENLVHALLNGAKEM